MMKGSQTVKCAGLGTVPARFSDTQTPNTALFSYSSFLSHLLPPPTAFFKYRRGKSVQFFWAECSVESLFSNSCLHLVGAYRLSHSCQLNSRSFFITHVAVLWLCKIFSTDTVHRWLFFVTYDPLSWNISLWDIPKTYLPQSFSTRCFCWSLMFSCSFHLP